MAVTRVDVRHVADLARLAVSEAHLDELVGELNGILTHMDILAQVDASTADETSSDGTHTDSTPLRSDSSGPLAMELPLGSFAPSTRDGFVIVPRLASHEDRGDITS